MSYGVEDGLPDKGNMRSVLTGKSKLFPRICTGKKLCKERVSRVFVTSPTATVHRLLYEAENCIDAQVVPKQRHLEMAPSRLIGKKLLLCHSHMA